MDLARVKYRIAHAKSQIQDMFERPDQPDEILKTIVDVRCNDTQTRIWYDFDAALMEHGCLALTARRSSVTSINWLWSMVAEVTLQDTTSIFFLSHLGPVPEDSKIDDLGIGDNVLLTGQFVVVLASDNEGEVEFWKVINYMKIVNVKRAKIGVGRRGKNRMVGTWEDTAPMTVCNLH